MIVTILPGSGDFHAIRYNEKKVTLGAATLLEKENISLSDNCTTEDLVNFFKLYSEQNSRIQKPQFHVAVSCQGRDMTEKELLEFAHKWLKDMGYAEPGQPLLIYSHHDTDNNHLHIVTSRVAPDGRKIDNNHERRRSQKSIDRIIGQNRKDQSLPDMLSAQKYAFSSLAQFKAVMGAMGYEVYEKEGTVYIKHGGSIRQKIPLAQLKMYFKPYRQDWQRYRRQRAILQRYRDASGNKEELKRALKEKFGIDLVFFGRKDKPYGYMIVDHNKKTVINGAKVLPVDELLDFATPEERFARIDSFIDNLFAVNPKVTRGEINKKLRKMNAYLKDDAVHYNEKIHQLPRFMAEALERNEGIALVERYRPASEAERDALCKLLKVREKDLISLSYTIPKEYGDALSDVRELFSRKEPLRMDEHFRIGHIGFIRHEEVTYAIDVEQNVIVNLNEEGLDVSRLIWPVQEQQKKRQPVKRIKRYELNDVGGGSQSENREWEVGQKDKQDDDIGRGRSLKL